MPEVGCWCSGSQGGVAKWWAHRTVHAEYNAKTGFKEFRWVWRISIWGSSLSSDFQGKLIILCELRSLSHLFSICLPCLPCLLHGCRIWAKATPGVDETAEEDGGPSTSLPTTEYVAVWNQHMTYTVHRMLDWRETYLHSVGYYGEISVCQLKTRHGALWPNVWSNIFLLVKKAKNKKGKIEWWTLGLEAYWFNHIAHPWQTAPPSSTVRERAGHCFVCFIMFHHCCTFCYVSDVSIEFCRVMCSDVYRPFGAGTLWPLQHCSGELVAKQEGPTPAPGAPLEETGWSGLWEPQRVHVRCCLHIFIVDPTWSYNNWECAVCQKIRICSAWLFARSSVKHTYMMGDSRNVMECPSPLQESCFWSLHDSLIILLPGSG